MSVKNKIRCASCTFVKEDATMNTRKWKAYECGNPQSEFHKSLLNVSVHGNKQPAITWSGCSCAVRRAKNDKR